MPKIMADNPSKPPKNEINPVVAIVIIVVAAGAIINFLIENAAKTPMVRSFEEGARQSEISACETRKLVEKTNEDCYK